uniref:Glycerol-3-phosphate acyltransferase 4 n=1 Tax=Bos indicus x Bos taurus TaxID=30522 RepID=A0A4W2HEZ7_BOBOX
MELATRQPASPPPAPSLGSPPPPSPPPPLPASPPPRLPGPPLGASSAGLLAPRPSEPRLLIPAHLSAPPSQPTTRRPVSPSLRAPPLEAPPTSGLHLPGPTLGSLSVISPRPAPRSPASSALPTSGPRLPASRAHHSATRLLLSRRPAPYRPALRGHAQLCRARAGAWVRGVRLDGGGRGWGWDERVTSRRRRQRAGARTFLRTPGAGGGGGEGGTDGARRDLAPGASRWWATLRMERGAKEKNHQLYKPYTNGIIAKDPTSLEEEIKEIRRSGSSKALDNTPEFELSDIFYFCRKGMETIMDDEVTKRFSAEELESWNLLSRTNYNFQYISLRLTVLWGLGVLIRYCLLLPLRIALAFTGISLLVVGTTMVGYLPNGRFKEFLSKHVHLMCYRICVRALTAIITYHDRKNRPRNGGICVANHTSPIDVIILASDGYYAMVGQVHGGLMGVIQRAMVKACPHVWFERSEVKDRHLVARRLTEHVQDKSKLPILIFPEGTCINNTSVMMFKKGSFEIGATVYPVAIKVGALRGPVVLTAAAANGRLQPTPQSIRGLADLPTCSSLFINPAARKTLHLKGASCGAGTPGGSVRLLEGAGGWA